MGPPMFGPPKFGPPKLGPPMPGPPKLGPPIFGPPNPPIGGPKFGPGGLIPCWLNCGGIGGFGRLFPLALASPKQNPIDYTQLKATNDNLTKGYTKEICSWK